MGQTDLQWLAQLLPPPPPPSPPYQHRRSPYPNHFVNHHHNVTHSNGIGKTNLQWTALLPPPPPPLLPYPRRRRRRRLPPPLPLPLQSPTARGQYHGVDDRQVTTDFTVEPSFHHWHSTNPVSRSVTIVGERAVTSDLVVRRRWKRFMILGLSSADGGMTVGL